MRRVNISIRVIGVIGFAAGLYLLLWQGGKTYDITVSGVSFPIPVDLVCILFGAALAVSPELGVYVLAVFLPTKYKRRLLDTAESLIARGKAQSTEVPLAIQLQQNSRSAKQRFYIALALTMLFLVVGVPLLIDRLSTRSDYKRESEHFVRLVQEIRLEFASADQVREHLAQGEAIIHSRPTYATRLIYDLLLRLYDPSIASSAAFKETTSKIYQETIKPNVSSETGLLRIERIKAPQSSSESSIASVTYLTLLATICNDQGEHGAHVDPYLQARQLLQSAIAKDQNKTLSLPATYNAFGVSCLGLLKCYDDYAAKFRGDSTVVENVKSSLGEAVPLTHLALANRASAAYRTAADESSTNLTTARYLNNRVDLLLSFLHMIYFGGLSVNGEIRDKDDQRFLEEEVYSPTSGKEVQPKRLLEILDNWRNDLNKALALSREPEIFFTRAQLYSLGGALNERYHFEDAFWGSASETGIAVLSDLRIARSMQLQNKLFERANSKQYYLEWIWTQEAIRPALEQLSK